MAERKQIALIYDYDLNWIGGTYYILNIIRALNFLPDEEKPQLTIFYDRFSSLVDIKKIDYPYITFISIKYRLSHLAKIINKISLLTIRRDLITVKLPVDRVDNFYYRPFVIDKSNIGNYYCWIADLQDRYLPHFFKKRELAYRLATYKRIIRENEPIVFSSQTTLNDFNTCFPKNKNQKNVLRFVSIADNNFYSLSIADIKKKYNIVGDYFIVPNQIWKHKNHMVVLNAFTDIFKRHPDLKIVLTGKEGDYRDPNYINEVKNFVADNNLQDKIVFLAFIDRDEQLKLMAESIAIIQPSLFEGWSTVIEDAKLLNKCIICSDIPVHHEQLPDSHLFFNPNDKDELIKLVEAVIKGQVKFKIDYNHEQAILAFARGFIDLF